MLHDWRAQIYVLNSSPENMDAAPVTLLDEAMLDTDLDHNATAAIATQFLNEFNTRAKIRKHDTVNRRFDKFPTVLRFALLISPISRAALRLVTNFMPLPCPNTAYNHYLDKLKDAESALSNIEKLDDRIAIFMEKNQLPDHAPVSVARDAMTMTHYPSYLPGKNADHSFVIYGQPLDRNYRCFPFM
jgi:hypothetical protein